MYQIEILVIRFNINIQLSLVFVWNMLDIVKNEIFIVLNKINYQVIYMY